MNNKKFMNALLFSAALLSTGMVSSCKDYDDDINTLRDRVSAVETSIAELQKQIQEGKWVTSFEQSAKGYVLTLSDGSKLEIKNGEKGDTGAAGQNGTSWKIDDTTKEWVKVNPDGTEEKTGIIAEGAKGDQGEQGPQGPAGENGKSPKIENGVWMVWDDEKGDYVEAGSAVGTASYIVEYDAYWELNMVVADAEGNPSTKFAKIILPKTAEISSLEVYALSEDGTSLGTPNIDLSIGRVKGNKPVEFNGKTYQPGEVLVSKSTSLVAQVNPLKADASKYTFHLVDSKGQTKFEVSEATPNLSEAALTKTTRAAGAELTKNPGLWNLALTVPQGVVVEAGSKAVYSLQTNSISEESTLIASRFDIAVNVETAESGTPYWKEATLEAGQPVSWAELWEQSISQPLVGKFEVADYYFAIEEGKIAQAEKDGVVLDNGGKTLTINKPTSSPIDYIDIHYLRLNGTIGEYKNYKVNVKATSEIALETPFVFDLNKANAGQDDKVSVKVLGNDALNAFITNVNGETKIDATYKFTNSNVTVDGETIDQDKVDLPAILGKVTFTAEKDEDGYYQWKATMTFDETKVFAEEYDGTVELKNNNGEVKLLNFKVQVKAPKAYDFKAKRNAAYFNGDAASAYSEISSTNPGKTEYDLHKLYGINDWTNITFDEVLPVKIEKELKGEAWITADGHSLLVKKFNGFDGAGSTRTMRAIHRPFDNKNLNASVDEFELTVRSEINEGTFEYKKNASQDITVGKTITLNRTDITAKDVYEKDYDFTSSQEKRIEKYEVKWDANAQKYLNVGATSTYKDGKIEIKRKDEQTVVENDTPCVGTITVTDAWGMTKSTKVTIVVKKNK